MMILKRLCLISYSLLLLCCGKDEDLKAKQETFIASWLNGKNVTDYTAQSGVFTYVPNSGRSSYATDPFAEKGDSVYFLFQSQIFTSSGPQAVYYSNKPWFFIANPTLNPRYWPLDLMGAKIGSTPLIEGLRVGLPGCHQGDSLVMICTYDKAYGDKDVGVVPRNSAVFMAFDIVQVVKQ